MKSVTLKVAGAIALTLGWWCVGVAAPATFPASQQEYWAQLDRHDWTAAIASAEQLVATARATAPPDPQRLADALVLLGNAQLGSQNAIGAEAAYKEALGLVESRVSPISEKLLDPLRGLGYAYAAQSKHAQAIPLLDQALTVSRRNAGLFDPSQQGLLRQLAASLTATDAPLEAEKHIRYLLLIGERAYGASDPRMVPLMCMVGGWYAQIGSMDTARQYYREAYELAQEKVGKVSLAVIEPLRGLASSYRRELLLSNAGMLRQPESEPSFGDDAVREPRPITAQFLNSEGERALLHAVQVLDGIPDRPTTLMIETLVDAGDWYQTRNQPQKAFPFYRRAAALVGSADTGSPASLSFAFPVQIYLPTPVLALRNRSKPDSEVDQRFVQVEFTVTGEGAVKDARVVDEDGTSRQRAETLTAIQSARYRPRFIAGEPVETTAVSHRQTFRTRKENKDDKDKEVEKDKAS
ncbi:MAG: energy transducer TonB [Steroidobacteraceae bacterium]